MTKEEIAILEKIVEVDGDCLKAEICRMCPFRSECLPNFLHRKTRLSKIERFDRALNKIVRMEIMEDQ